MSGNKDLLKVSTYLLEKEVFSADTDVGSVTIYPTKRIEIRKDDSVSIWTLIDLQVSSYDLNPHVGAQQRFGEDSVVPAEYSEYYASFDDDNNAVMKLKVTYKCKKSYFLSNTPRSCSTLVWS